MNAPLAQLVALVPLCSLAAGGGDAVPRDLELASLAVTDGIRGGFVGPMPHVLLAAGYDRVERGFRVVRRRPGPDGDEVWVAELEPERFRALLELAVASGLPELPLENPPSCIDVYGRGRQIRLDYGKVRWANGAPGGCVTMPSTVIPSEDELRRFDAVVLGLERAVDALSLRRGTEVELQRVQFFSDVRVLDTYHRVMEHVLTDPVRHRLDLERVSPRDDWVGFRWRGCDGGAPGGDEHFRLGPSGTVLHSSPARPVTRDRSVPVETGMSLAEVLQRLGEPDAREERADGSLVLTYPGSNQDAEGVRRFVRPARLRFENGRLSEP